jgi:4-nitrophenyl phosphatase
MERRAERAVVGDDEQAGDSAGSGRGPGLIDQAQDQVVGGAPSRMADDEPGRDPLAAEAGVGRPVEHELDADVCRDRATQPTDQRRGRHLVTTPSERGQEVRTVDDQSIGGGERVAGRCHRRIVRARTPTATIGRVSLLLLVDLDGVVYRGAEPIPGVAAVLADRAARGDDIVYVTNNSMHYRADYVARLSAMGCPVSAERVVSSSRATALHIVNHETGIRRILALGAGGLERELGDVGLEVVTVGHAATRMHQEGIDGWTAAGSPDAVVTGLDPNLTYLRLAAAADCIRAGARFIATNRDPVYPTERGLRPGAGAIAAALEATTGVTPLSIGKPEPHLLELAAEAVGRTADEAVMIGDGIGTDLAAARAVGARSVLMLTGVTTRADLEALTKEGRPDAVATDAAGLAAALDTIERSPGT